MPNLLALHKNQSDLLVYNKNQSNLLEYKQNQSSGSKTATPRVTRSSSRASGATAYSSSTEVIISRD